MQFPVQHKLIILMFFKNYFSNQQTPVFKAWHF
jgi:hypothetical protein